MGTGLVLPYCCAHRFNQRSIQMPICDALRSLLKNTDRFSCLRTHDAIRATGINAQSIEIHL